MWTIPSVGYSISSKIPAFMFGSGYCPSKPCGYTSEMPFHLCPKKQEQKYCEVLDHIDMELFERHIRLRGETMASEIIYLEYFYFE